MDFPMNGLAAAAGALFGGGSVVGAYRQKIKSLEARVDDLEDKADSHQEVSERLASVEGKIDTLIALHQKPGGAL